MRIAIWFDKGHIQRHAGVSWHAEGATVTDLTDLELRLGKLAEDLDAGIELPSAKHNAYQIDLGPNGVVPLDADDVLVQLTRSPGQPFTAFDFLSCARPSALQARVAAKVADALACGVLGQMMSASAAHDAEMRRQGEQIAAGLNGPERWPQ